MSFINYRLYCITLLFALTVTAGFAQYDLAWGKVLGGKKWDMANCVIETKDKNLVVVGHTNQSVTYSHDNPLLSGYDPAPKGGRLLWIVKLSPYGHELWGSTFNNEHFCSAEKVIEDSEGNLVLCGTKYIQETFSSDIWVMKIKMERHKIDSIRYRDTAIVLWQETYGNPRNDDEAFGLCETYDGGYVVAGYTKDRIYDRPDFVTLKIDRNGQKLWQESLGEKDTEIAYDVIECSQDKGIMAVGFANNAGDAARAVMLVKYTADGMLEWSETYPRRVENMISWDVASAVIETRDHHFVIAGFSKSGEGTNYDMRIFKLDDFGDVVWDTIHGSGAWEEATDIVETFDGGYAVSGFSKLHSGEYNDFWVMKLSSTGKREWDKMYGGRGFDYGKSIIETTDKGLVVAGSTYYNEGLGWDFAVFKLVHEGVSQHIIPKINRWNPKTPLVVTDSSTFRIQACVQTADTVKRIQFYVNDSLQLQRTQINFNLLNDTCNTFINEVVRLKQGENKISIRAYNSVGSSKDLKIRIYYLPLFRVEW